MKLNNNKGFTGVDIAVSTVILIIFVSLITTMFYNLSVTSKKIERKTIATNLAIQTIEAMKIINFDNLTETMTISEINNFIENKIVTPNDGYEIEVKVDNTTYPDVIKIISAQVNYKSGKNTENVKIETLVKNINYGPTTNIIDRPMFGKVTWSGGKAITTISTDTSYNIEYQINGTDGTWIPIANGGAVTGINDGDIIYARLTDGKNVGKSINSNIKAGIYVTLYSDGTLGFSNNTEKMAGKTIVKEYGDIKDKVYKQTKVNNTSLDGNEFDTPWFLDGHVNDIKTVVFVNEIIPTDMSYWFANCRNVTTFQNFENLYMYNVQSVKWMFFYCDSITSLDVSQMHTTNVKNMSGMFLGLIKCKEIKGLGTSNFITSSVTNMSQMFTSCPNLTTLDVSKLDTSKVTNMASMFANYYSGIYNSVITKITGLENFDTSKVTNMYECLQDK